MPTTPTFVSDPHPFLTKGEYTVKPPHNMDAASRDSSPSGIGKTNCSFAIIPVEYPPNVRTPSGYAWP